MQITRLFRENYIGEFITTSKQIVNGIQEESRQWIPNTIELNIDSDSAVVIGNGMSRIDFDLEQIKKHKGGHLAQHKLYSYGCNALYREFTPNFLIATNDCMVDEIAASEYCDDNIVYTINQYIPKYPGKFHLIPYGVQQNAGTMATWLAAFDGFKRVFLLGFDTQDSVGLNNNLYAGTDCYEDRHADICDDKWSNAMYNIFRQYYDVEFIRVMPGPNPVTPLSWKGCLNFRNVTYRDFVSYADL